MNEFINRNELEQFANRMVRKDLALPLLDDDSPLPGFIRAIDSQLAEAYNSNKLLLPNLKQSKTFSVFSDYGGEHNESPYFTYSFLFNEYDSMGMFSKEMQQIREKFGLNSKEISFKDLNYGPINRALPAILKASDYLVNGVLFTLIVDKRVQTLFGNNPHETKREIIRILKENGINNWHPKISEKMLRIIHLISYFSKLLSLKGQKFFWMTDRDAIIENRLKSDGLSKVMQGLMQYYLGDNYFSLIGYAHSFDEQNILDFSAFLSLSDLVAGSVCDYYLHSQKYGEPSIGKEQVNTILEWLCHDGLLLKKLNCIISVNEDDSYNCGILKFNLKERPSNHNDIKINFK